jgi:hypothetical protein
MAVSLPAVRKKRLKKAATKYFILQSQPCLLKTFMLW